MSHKAVSESSSTSGSRSSAGREKFHRAFIYINSDIYGDTVCEASRGHPHRTCACRCSRFRLHTYAPVKSPANISPGLHCDCDDFTGKPRPIVPYSPRFFSLQYPAGREVRIISPFAGATMCGTGRAFIYETGVAVKSQIATQICRADNNGASRRARKKLLRTLARTRRRKRVRAVGTSRGLALSTRL